MADHDVIVLGAGPAGLAIAGALLRQGLRVARVAPEPGDAPPRWAPTYAAWQDELDEVGAGDCVDIRWSGADVVLDGARAHALPRAYARVDKAALAARLWEASAGAAHLPGTAVAVTHDATHSALTVKLPDGRLTTQSASVLIDASGHRPALLRVPAKPAPAWQTAIGRTIDAPDAPWSRDRAVLMDYTPLGADGPTAPPRGNTRDTSDDAPPSFLYVLPLPDGRYFVEETVLAARPHLGREPLRARLTSRLAQLGVSLAPVRSGGGVAGGHAPPPDDHAGEEEWVSIPMGGALPSDPNVLGFGAAAGMIHPATGYLLPRVLGGADPLAQSVAEGLGRGDAPTSVVADGWATLWSPERRQRRALYRFGLEALLGMDGPSTRDFFDRFFRLPAPDWAGYLSDRHAPVALRGVMWRLFAGAPMGLRWKLAQAGFGREGAALLQSMLGG